MLALLRVRFSMNADGWICIVKHKIQITKTCILGGQKRLFCLGTSIFLVSVLNVRYGSMDLYFVKICARISILPQFSNLFLWMFSVFGSLTYYSMYKNITILWISSYSNVSHMPWNAYSWFVLWPVLDVILSESGYSKRNTKIYWIV